MPVAQERGVRLPREERRAQLLVAARAVFVAQGYHAAAMDDIAERAGVSKPVLYQHFPGKLDLYLALLDEGSQALISAVGDALGSTTDNKLRVQATMQAYFAFVDDPDGAFRLVFESDLTNDSQVRDRIAEADRACAEMISHVIAEDTGLGQAEAMLLAYALIGLARDASLRWLRDAHDPSRLPRAAAADLVATLGWRGIRGFPLSHPPRT